MDPSFLHADSEDSDQTGRIPRLIWVFAGCTCHFVDFVMKQLSFQMANSRQDYWNKVVGEAEMISVTTAKKEN